MTTELPHGFRLIPGAHYKRNDFGFVVQESGKPVVERCFFLQRKVFGLFWWDVFFFDMLCFLSEDEASAAAWAKAGRSQ